MAPSTWTITHCGSIPAIPAICWSATTVACTKASSEARPGSTRRTCRSPSSTRSAIDNDFPFYNVYGGTQDNNTIGGPTRTNTTNGISNYDWYITLGGDGFDPAIDPGNPDIVYSQWQYGNLHALRPSSGESQDIQPQPEAGEVLKWNWASALIISPHDPARLYYGSQKLFRSDDRGDSWVKVSGDLTRQLDRNALPVDGPRVER